MMGTSQQAIGVANVGSTTSKINVTHAETKQHARHSLKNKTQNLVTTCQDGRISTICCHQVGAPVRAKV